MTASVVCARTSTRRRYIEPCIHTLEYTRVPVCVLLLLYIIHSSTLCVLLLLLCMSSV